MRKTKWILEMLCIIEMVFFVVLRLLLIFRNIWGYEIWYYIIRMRVRFGISIFGGDIIFLLIHLWPVLYLGKYALSKFKHGYNDYKHRFNTILFWIYITFMCLSSLATKIILGAWFI